MIFMRLIWRHLLHVGQFSSKYEIAPVNKHGFLEVMHRSMPNRRTIKLLQTDNHNINTQFYIQDIHA